MNKVANLNSKAMSPMKNGHFIDVVTALLEAHPKFASLLNGCSTTTEREHAIRIVAADVAKRLPSQASRRLFLQHTALAAGAVGTLAVVPSTAALSASYAGLLQKAVELLRRIISGAQQALSFFEHTLASLYKTDVTSSADRNGEVQYFNSDGSTALSPANFQVNEGRDFTFAATNQRGGGSAGLLHRPGSSPAEFSRMRENEIAQLPEIERKANSPFVVPADSWEPLTHGFSPTTVRNKIIDEGLDPAIWKGTSARRYDRAKYGLGRDSFIAINANNTLTGANRILV